MVAFSRGEPGTLSYQRFISADGSTLHVQERYASSEAMLEHNQAFAALFSPRFATMVRLALGVKAILMSPCVSP
jgi:quinol monooxygenase YgiN